MVPVTRRDSMLGLALLFVGALCFLGMFAHGYVENGDAEMSMHSARAWWLRGDPGLLRAGPDTTLAERTIADWIHTPGAPDYGLVGRNGKAYVWFPIGHQALLVPCMALGDLFAQAFPAPQTQLVAMKGEVFGVLFWSRFFVSLLPILFAAGTVVVVYLLGRTLSLAVRPALLVTVVATLCTAFWPGSSETMSDVPGTFFLLWATLCVFRYREKVIAGAGGWRELWLGGLVAGVAVLVRYPHAVPVLVLSVAAFAVAWRARRKRDLLALVLGGLPGAVALLAANHLRFGSLFETGYSAGATPAWWSYPPWLGIPLILLSPGKGILWFSLPLWPALAQLFRRATWRPAWPWFVTLGCLVLPIIISGHTAGWAGGQCWSVRYVTAGVVLAVTVGLALGRPWERRPRTFFLWCALAFLVSSGGVLTPYRGDRELVSYATAAAHPEVPRDMHDTLPVLWDFEPRFSPLKSHWIYAWLSASGRLQQGGSGNTTEPLFGVRVEPDRPTLRPSQPEDVAFRHWWWRYGALFGWPQWPAAVVAALAVVACWLAARVLSRRAADA